MIFTKPLSQTIIITVVSLLFFGIYSGFYMINNQIFNSPDETAANYFIKEFALNNRLAVPASMSGAAGEVITPRSMRVSGGFLVPASFLGLITIYGTIAELFSIFSLWIVVGLTGVLGVIGFYFLIGEVWNKNIAFYSAMLMFVFPGWWYYASLGLYHNVLLVTLLIWSVVFWIKYQKTFKRHWFYISSVAVSLALITRLAAMPWIALLWLIIFYVSYRQKNIKPINWLIWGAIIGVFLIVFSFLNQNLYSSRVTAGYVLPTSGETSMMMAYFPQGIHPKTAIINFWNYGLKFFWYFAAPAYLGLYFFILNWKKISVSRKIYISVSALISGWLIIYYGSWNLTDNINFFEVSLGESYIRYWLPIYILSLPLAVYGFSRAFNKLKLTANNLKIVVAFLAIGYLIIGFKVTYLNKTDSLLLVSSTLKQNSEIKREVLALTPTDAVIISDRHDKVFFPERDVIHTLNNQEIFALLPDILASRPVWLYTILSESELDNLISQPLSKYKIQLANPKLDNSLWELSYEK